MDECGHHGPPNNRKFLTYQSHYLLEVPKSIYCHGTPKYHGTSVGNAGHMVLMAMQLVH